MTLVLVPGRENKLYVKQFHGRAYQHKKRKELHDNSCLNKHLTSSCQMSQIKSYHYDFNNTYFCPYSHKKSFFFKCIRFSIQLMKKELAAMDD